MEVEWTPLDKGRGGEGRGGDGRGGEGGQYYNVIWHCERVEGRQ